MKRLVRRLFNILAAVSLLLCISAPVLAEIAGKFHRQYVTVYWTLEPRIYYRVIKWDRRGFLFERQIMRPPDYFPNSSADWIDSCRKGFGPPQTTVSRWTTDPDMDIEKLFPSDPRSSMLAFRGGYSYSIDFHDVCVASLVVFVLCMFISLFRSRRMKRQARTGHCIHCGYDLRATPGRCPECGAVPIVVK